MSILKYCKYLTLIALALTARAVVPATPPEYGEKQPLRYAKNFEIADFHTHRIVTVLNGSTDSSLSYQYALVPRGVPAPELPEDIPIIRTPVKRVVVLETVYIGFLDALNQLDTIIGASTTDYVINPTVRKHIEEGTIQKVQTGQAPNIERLLLLQPDLIFASAPSEPTLNIPAQLTRAGLPSVITAEYKEHHPLARAEWIKFIAAFFDATEEADKTFETVANRYEALLEKIDMLEKRPTAFCGAPYSGVWHMAKGDSYIAQFIHDAGGDYLWSDVPGTDVIPLDTERVFLKAANADIWLNPSLYSNRQTLFAADPRFKKFHATQTGNLYNNTKQQTTETGNPIWETGIVRPDDVLADLIKIFQPDRMPDCEFIYYEQLK
jgi:iron complex transport system substrate-binding protein